MNARHEVNLFDEADEIAPHDEREFREWSAIVSAESTLRSAIENRNPLAITYAHQLASLASGARRAPPPPIPTDGDPF